MFFSKKQIARAFEDYIRNNDSDYRNWYVGIASEPRERLFNDHNVDEQKGQWLYSEATSADAARVVERYFVNVKGTKGGSGEGDSNSCYVYAYKIYQQTRQ